MENAQANYEAYNVGGGRAITMADFARLVAKVVGKAIAPEMPGQFRFGDTRHIFSDIAKLRALGWEPRVSLDEIVTEYVAWARAQPDMHDYYAEAEREMKTRGTLRET
jgi:dTDP-L-rhamnose 4-epimerase